MNEHRDLALEARIQQTLDVGNHVWVIGDVHGYFETLQELLKKLDYTDDDVIIFMGDLIDKGPNSKAVFELVTKAENFFSIRGNHEEMLRLSLTPKYKGRMKKSWLKYGGKQTLDSISQDDELALKEAANWIPLIEAMPTELVLNDFRIVHAGYNPISNLESQTNKDRMWNREIFEWENIFDSQRQIIVGHTPIQTLGCRPNDGIWEGKLRLKDGRSSVVCIDGGVALRDSDSALIAYNLLDNTIRILPKIEQDYFSVNLS